MEKDISSMKTIEERAREHLANGWLGSLIDAYIQGATEQKEIDIDKACEWLKAYCGMNESGLVQFRKAMEE